MALEEKLYANQFERNIVGSSIKSLSNKWTFYILKDLFLGKKRFTQFQENRPNLDNKSLSRCLKSRKNNNLIEKRLMIMNRIFFNFKRNKVLYELIIFALDTHEGDFYTDDKITFIKETYIDILDLDGG